MDTRLMQDQQVRRHFIFLLSLSFFLLIAAMIFCRGAAHDARAMLLHHDESIAASLTAQGISEVVIARALTDSCVILGDEKMEAGADILRKIGIRPALETQFLPPLLHFQQNTGIRALALVLPACIVLLGASLLFLYKRDSLYRRAASIIDDYTDGCFSCRLPQTDEGSLFRMFSAIDRLATMLQAQNDTERASKIFLRNTISDISHQLKTPLAALSMYQEIMENEPDKPDVIRHFAARTGTALRRMEQLIQSMLRITRLDAGNVVFEKQPCDLQELISHAVSELTTRAENERKQILMEGSSAANSCTATVVCDPAWTGEAIGNLVKNALDHTRAGGIIRITWEASPISAVIRIDDNGDGIAPEELHHIFKRFYRSSQSSDTQGIGLGLPLAKAIVEGQGGTIAVQSTLRVGTCFTMMFPKSPCDQHLTNP
ncbi:MAG: HAMP domain-containing histidine kinase [Lachnospiraceae bacterium]|nr:HAMP domain-containing histidine kinase [Lachnospiraceae bacterium]